MRKHTTTSPQPIESNDALAGDILWGVDGDNGIAKFIGRDAKQTYYLIRSGQIPVRKLGHKTITASKKELRKKFGAEQ
jgi:hypothetical protein